MCKILQVPPTNWLWHQSIMLSGYWVVGFRNGATSANFTPFPRLGKQQRWERGKWIDGLQGPLGRKWKLLMQLGRKEQHASIPLPESYLVNEIYGPSKILFVPWFLIRGLRSCCGCGCFVPLLSPGKPRVYCWIRRNVNLQKTWLTFVPNQQSATGFLEKVLGQKAKINK